MKDKNTEAVYHIYVIIQYKVTGWPLGPGSRHKLPIMSSEQPCVWFVARACRDWKLQNTFRPRREERHKNEIKPILFSGSCLNSLAWFCLDSEYYQTRSSWRVSDSSLAPEDRIKCTFDFSGPRPGPGTVFPIWLEARWNPIVQCPRAGWNPMVQCQPGPVSHLWPPHPLWAKS